MQLRFLRKHSTALIALAVYHFVFFFPTLFMGRVVSPNDVFFNFDRGGRSGRPTYRIRCSTIHLPRTTR